MAPRIDKVNLKTVTVKAGQTIVVDVNFVAEPEPTAHWSLEGKVIENGERSSLSLAPNAAKLTIINSKRSDTGKYSIKLTNSTGSDSAFIDVVVLCKKFKNYDFFFKLEQTIKLILIFSCSWSAKRPD